MCGAGEVCADIDMTVAEPPSRPKKNFPARTRQMSMQSEFPTRREFLAGAFVAATVPQFAHAFDERKSIPLGFDNFAVRAMGWKADQLLDYAKKLQVDSILISDLDAFESLEPSHLEKIKARAVEIGVGIHLGTWSICPTSTAFRKNRGTAEEHLAVGLRSAAALGSPVLRVVLGNGADRDTPGGIKARIEDTVAVCKSQQSLAEKLQVKIAVENHAGDLQAHELVSLVEKAGKSYVGVNLDSGNSTWTMEDPSVALELLGPYTVSTSLRDSMVWESPNGATVQWTAMGEGVVDWKKYFDRFQSLCPGVPVHIETISGFNREIPFLKPGFWKNFPEARASDLAAYLALAKRGKPKPTNSTPRGADPKVAERAYQMGELERSLAYCRSIGLGIKKS
jgi:3-oxoisoapionate decarboxylase